VIKRIIKLGILGGVVFVAGSAMFKIIGGIIALLALALLIIFVIFVKHLFHRKSEVG